MKFFLFILLLLFAKSGLEIKAQKAYFSNLQEVNTSVSPYFSALQHDYDVKFYFIDLEISNTSTYIKGQTSILVESRKSNLDTLVFELSHTLSIDSLIVNSENISHFIFSNNLIKIPLPESLKNEVFLNTTVFYQGYTGSGGFFSGVTSRRESKYDKWVTYTLSEPFQAKSWFPCKQDLTDKADSAWIFLTVNNNLKAGSNGILTGLSPVGDDKTRFEWKTKYPITYYLLSFSVSDYKEYTFYVDIPGTDHSMPVQNYLYNHPSLPGNEKENIDVTEDLLILYSDLLGIYPFYKEKYGHCLAPMGGGMEHQTMTTLTNFNFALVAHELAHQWYGNYLTCKTWQDIWINEGFASYLEYVAIEKLRTKKEAKTWIESAQNSAKAFPEGSVYINTEDAFNVNRIFNMELSYKKGALILHMLRFEMDNDFLFFGILKDFLSLHAFGVASGADFIEFLNSTTGEDYDWFFNQWYYGQGYPLFLVSWSQSPDSLIIKSIQETSSSNTPFFRTKMDYKLVYTDGSEEILRLHHVKMEERFTFYTDKVIDYIIADPENIIIKNAVVLKHVTANQWFEVSPNPFSNKLTIRFRSAGENRLIRINAINGNHVFETQVGSGSFSHDFSFLKPGVYILSVSDGKNDHSVKIVKSSKPGS